MTETTSLLPCPFCGGQPLLEGTSPLDPRESRCTYVVRCRNCAAQGPWFQTEGNAVIGWNRRQKP